MIAKRLEAGKIVVPWNYSNLSMAALNSAWEIVGDSSQIRVIHVATPLPGPEIGSLHESAAIQNARELKERFHKQLGNDQRFRDVQFYVNYGHVAQEIVRFAESYRAGLIVIASRDRKGITRLLFGGVAESVVRLAKCPVLTLRGENGDRNINNALWSNFVAPRKRHKKPAVSYRHGM